MSITIADLARRDSLFAAKLVESSDGCWIYTGSIGSTGYGTVGRSGRTYSAHRYAYALAGGTLRDGWVLDHLCNLRTCANPEHLDQTKQRANVLRANGIPSRNRAKSECVNGHPYTDAHRLPHSRCCRVVRRDVRSECGMSGWQWLLYCLLTVGNVALYVYNLVTSRWCRQVMRDVPQRLAIAWNTGYQRGMRDELLDVQHGADNPYLDGPAMREWRES